MTRALVNNLYSDYYVTEDGTSYDANSANNVKALTLLQNMVNAGSLSANASYAAADELQAFANQTCAVSFCWNFSNYSQYADQTQFTPFAMAFPSDDGTPELEMAGPYGFGIFDNKDQAKIDAAKKFIDFVCNDATAGVEAVKTPASSPCTPTGAMSTPTLRMRPARSLRSDERLPGPLLQPDRRLDRAARPVVAHAG